MPSLVFSHPSLHYASPMSFPFPRCTFPHGFTNKFPCAFPMGSLVPSPMGSLVRSPVGALFVPTWVPLCILPWVSFCLQKRRIGGLYRNTRARARGARMSAKREKYALVHRDEARQSACCAGLVPLCVPSSSGP